ncbi:hypothetical protein HKX48_001789 [Thoreauomyces humboldtii]|nr:hypothetical protein HKX48_001789 [Thoreauomyces humboldtii]
MNGSQKPVENEPVGNTVDGLLVAIAAASSATYSTAVDILFGFTVAYYVTFCAYFFWIITRSVQHQMRQMVGVVFWLAPEVLVDAPVLAQMVDMGSLLPHQVKKKSV